MATVQTIPIQNRDNPQIDKVFRINGALSLGYIEGVYEHTDDGEILRLLLEEIKHKLLHGDPEEAAVASNVLQKTQKEYIRSN